MTRHSPFHNAPRLERARVRFEEWGACGAIYASHRHILGKGLIAL